MQKIKVNLVVALFLVLTACSKSPMQWLHSDTRANHLNNAFWTKEQEGNTPLWQDATRYCKDHPEKVNCGAVNDVVMLQTNNTQLAPDGSGHEIWTPQ